MSEVITVAAASNCAVSMEPGPVTSFLYSAQVSSLERSGMDAMSRLTFTGTLLDVDGACAQGRDDVGSLELVRISRRVDRRCDGGYEGLAQPPAVQPVRSLDELLHALRQVAEFRPVLSEVFQDFFDDFFPS